MRWIYIFEKTEETVTRALEMPVGFGTFDHKFGQLARNPQIHVYTTHKPSFEHLKFRLQTLSNSTGLKFCRLVKR